MVSDFRLALRQLSRTRAFTVLVVITLSLGIGASTALFSVVQGALLRPLDLPDASRLVRIWVNAPEHAVTRATLSFVRFEYLRERQQSFEELAASLDTYRTLTGRAQAEQLVAKQVSAHFFAVTGARPRLGRTFTEAEDRRGARAVAMISERLWQRHFEGSEQALGEEIVLDGVPHAIIGVVPANFGYPGAERVDLWLTGVAAPSLYTAQQVNDGAAYLNVTGRLRPDVSLPAARDEAARIAAAYRAEFPDRIDAASDLELIRFSEELVGQQRQALLILLGAVGLVHLIACFNVANLLLARFASRSRENAMRLALGATRMQLIRHFLAESLLLSTLAGILGTALAHGLLAGYSSLLRVVLPRAASATIDVASLGFVLGLTVFTGLALGVVPGALASRRSLMTTLKESARGSTAGLRAGSFRRAVLVAEVALSLILLISAGLFALSFLRLRGTDPGFRAEGVFLAGIELPRVAYDTPERQVAVAADLLARVGTLPGVRRAALGDSPPFHPTPILSPYAAANRPLAPINERLIALRGIVTPDYFRTLGIRLVAGRSFNEEDAPSRPTVAVVNETMARRLFEGAPAVGEKVILGITDRTAEIVGVVADSRVEAVATPPKPEIFFAFAQRPRVSFTLAIESDDDPSILAPSVRAILREIDRDIPLVNPRSLAAEVGQSLAGQRTSLALLGLFAGTALILASLGIYSVMSYLVLQRTGEISIRLLLGADVRNVRRMILWEGMRLTTGGIALGLAGAFGISQLLRRALYGVPPVHVPAYLGLATFLFLVAFAACSLAARRATKVDPLHSLRTE